MYSYDVADEGVKLISEDEMVDLLESTNHITQSTREVSQYKKLNNGDNKL